MRQWLTVTHVRRWHQHHHTGGTGPIYQGRFKSFPIQADDHYFTVCRYVEPQCVTSEPGDPRRELALVEPVAPLPRDASAMAERLAVASAPAVAAAR